jgi:hypothetical protein
MAQTYATEAPAVVLPVRASERMDNIPALDGLRFTAAFLVAASHYVIAVVQTQSGASTVSYVLATYTGIGMTLFFVLSGFVIHHNYRGINAETGGVRKFLVGRFARLYPLYIVVLAVDFYLHYQVGFGSCGRALTPSAGFLALPYYLTLTQDWFYGVMCNSSLVYQYGEASSVTWSISVELFLYVAYLAIARPLARQQNIGWLIAVAAGAFLLLIRYFFWLTEQAVNIEHIAGVAFGPVATSATDYTNSLIRWLFYFNPLVCLVHFICGAVAAQIMHLQREKPDVARPEVVNGLTIAGIIALFALHGWLYGAIAPHNGFVGRMGSSLYGPLVAVILYAIARWPRSICAIVLATPMFVWLGEATYSIYLLHALFWHIPQRFFSLGLNPWVLWALSLVAVLLVSRLSYVLWERPSRAFIRRMFLTRDTSQRGPMASLP